jgi:pSer/pThr/pTyr-binding forkhead associated (FHA) protein
MPRIKLDDFIRQQSPLDKTSFSARYAHPFLVSEGPSAGSSAVYDAGSTRKVDRAAVGALPPSDGPDLVLVRRGEDSKYPSIITLGRSPECDVRLSHPLVSKRHAYFALEGSSWIVCDVDSANGTFAEGKRLTPHEKHRLSDGEPLRFGPELRYRFFTCDGFFQYMSVRIRMR